MNDTINNNSQFDLDIFQQSIKQGIPESLPDPYVYDNSVNHAPKRKKNSQ
ncbi:hypothetical protein JCM19294_1917 [Nonlabens tegetincola]|uniref:Uncharacterized protein n=1 Tax=Nonlabens tegetincola TaxID=323273 RepID=A0A090PZY0_9FLAO|nr:hypothetical protein JCM19294_1917 [Nonlabens tegetincola]